MQHTRAWSRAVWLSAILGANAAAWTLVAACAHDWDAYDPGLGTQQDASTDVDAATNDAGDADTGTDAAMDADAPLPHVTDGLLVLYDFEEGTGNVVNDVSGVSPPLPLDIVDPTAVDWIPGALQIKASTIVSSSGPATKVIDGCMMTNEITLEIWVRPDNLTQGGPARLITNSVDPSHRNFTLGQELGSYYQARLRSTGCLDAGGDAGCGENGTPYVATPPDEGDVTTVGLTHLLYTRDSTGVRRLYVNAVERATSLYGGDFSNWDTTFSLAVANEFTLDRTWLGDLHRAAVYNRALTQTEVVQNYEAGP